MSSYSEVVEVIDGLIQAESKAIGTVMVEEPREVREVVLGVLNVRLKAMMEVRAAVITAAIETLEADIAAQQHWMDDGGV